MNQSDCGANDPFDPRFVPAYRGGGYGYDDDEEDEEDELAAAFELLRLREAEEARERERQQRRHKHDVSAGEIKFSQYHPGRVDEHQGISHDGTSEGIYDSGHLYSHTVRKDGYVVYHRDQYGHVVIDTDE